MVSVVEMKSVYCMIWPGSLSKTSFISSLKGWIFCIWSSHMQSFPAVKFIFGGFYIKVIHLIFFKGSVTIIYFLMVKMYTFKSCLHTATLFTYDLQSDSDSTVFVIHLIFVIHFWQPEILLKCCTKIWTSRVVLNNLLQ